MQPDNTFSVLLYAEKRDAQMANPVGLETRAYPPGFTATDQQNLLVLMNKLARETSKVAINATNVTRQGQVYVESP